MFIFTEGDDRRLGQRHGVLEHRRDLRCRGVPPVERAGYHAHVLGRSLCLGHSLLRARDPEVLAQLRTPKGGSKVKMYSFFHLTFY